MRRNTGFTLIELLVVITIIVVLLALLAPALDKAVYQAQLAVCSTRLKSIATGALLYAGEFKRYYPNRPGVDFDSGFGSGKSNSTVALRPNNIANAGHTLDLRPIIRNHIPLNLLLDPLAPQGISLEDPFTLKESEVWANYELWFGYRYRQGQGAAAAKKKGMFRMGDRFEWDSSFYSLLASDHDMIDRDKRFGWGSHPDKGELGVGEVFNNKISGTSGASSGVNDPVGTGQQCVFTRWTWVPDNRGLLDMNFAYDDGSVRRYNDVEMDDKPRMDRIPEHADGALWPGRGNSVPAE